ncbi:sirohydrochlorin chelatase [Phormidium tenue FACHB-886]|nr:sirohydrochlorin chelatase [Phormidium tenue FACHB-886]
MSEKFSSGPLFKHPPTLGVSIAQEFALQSAYLLVTHGSRDPRPQQMLEQLAALVQQELARLPSLAAARPTLPNAASLEHSAPLVGTAVLELASLPLHEQIQQFAIAAIAAGYSQVKILPLFLLPGVHVMEDIPAEVAIAQRHLEGSTEPLSLTLAPHLGSFPLTSVLYETPIANRILIAHGSRRTGANQPIEAVANALEALPAYWSVSPSLEEQVTKLVEQGCLEIAIVPYFLFAGSITDAIAQQVSQLTQQFPYTRLELGEPIGATPALAKLIVNQVALSD